MLSAYLYRIRRQALKKPLTLILTVFVVLMAVGMMMLANLMNEVGSEDYVPRDPHMVVAGINIICLIFFNYIYFTALKNGILGFTLADVNFHLAGPFTSKFNLLLAASSMLQTVLIFLFMLVCQVYMLVSVFGFTTADLAWLMAGMFIAMAAGYFIGVFLSAFLDRWDGAKKYAYTGMIALDVIAVGGALMSAVSKAGSFAAFRSLGGRGMLSNIGDSIWLKAFPVSGWTGVFIEGIINNNIFLTVIGLLLVLGVIGLLVYLFLEVEFNYYETALSSAEKYEDMREARKAGIDTDTARMNRNIKVGNETLKGGWGASALTFRHFLQNSRSSRLFFVNSLTIMYRLMTVAYLFIMAKANSGTEDLTGKTLLFSGLAMTILLNAVLYGGGKTVLEFNKPFIYLIPEKASKKLFSSIAGDVPEMLFDAVITALIFYFMAHTSAVFSVILGVFFLMFNFVSELLGILTVRLFRDAGRILLVMLRYLLMGAALTVVAVPSLVAGFIFSLGMEGILTVMAVLLLALGGILMFASRNMIDHMEYGS